MRCGSTPGTVVGIPDTAPFGMPGCAECCRLREPAIPHSVSIMEMSPNPDLKAPKVEGDFVYPEELRNSKRVAVFRDFLLARLHDK